MWVTAYARTDPGPVLRVDNSNPPVPPPVGAVHFVEFDGETNPALQADLTANMEAYTIRDGVLWKGGRIAPVAPPGLQAVDLKERPGIVDKLKADEELTMHEVAVTLRYLLGPSVY